FSCCPVAAPAPVFHPHAPPARSGWQHVAHRPAVASAPRRYPPILPRWSARSLPRLARRFVPDDRAASGRRTSPPAREPEGRLIQRLALAAGPLATDMLVNAEHTWGVVELLGDVLADALHLATAGAS